MILVWECIICFCLVKADISTTCSPQTTLSLCPLGSVGDLYGAIGSPVRLTRTVVVGKQKDLVQRILYVLTYFLRCSELHENQLTWSGNHGEGDQVLNGSSITTALERGEVEESEYVVVTVRSEPALLPPILPPTAPAEGRSPGPEGLAGTREGTDFRDPCPKPDKEGNTSSVACSLGHQEPALDSSWKAQDALCGEEGSETEVPGDGCSRLSSREALGAGLVISEELKEEMPKKPPDRSAAWPCPDRRSRDKPPLGKVTFQIGSSASPESDFESRTQKMEEWLAACRQHPESGGCPSVESKVTADVAQDMQGSRCSFPPGFRQNVCHPQNQSSEGDGGELDRGYAEQGGIGAQAVAGAPGQLSQPADPLLPNAQEAGPGPRTLEKSRHLRSKDEKGPLREPVPGRCAQQDSGVSVSANVPCGDADRKANLRMEGDIPRNESSDSALGDSDDEPCAPATLDLGHSRDGTDGSSEVELPLPR